MIKHNAFDLVQQYINGWKQNNLDCILSCLEPECIIIESHGPRYQGIHDIEKWFAFWLEANSKILKWDILSLTFCEEKQIVFCEWDFACISNKIEYKLPGISVIRFSEEKIIFIHEYRMIQPAYGWMGDELKSE